MGPYLATSTGTVAQLTAEARGFHDRARAVLSTVESPLERTVEQASFLVTLAGCGYVSGRYNNPKVPVIDAPFELVGALFAFGGALAGMHFGAPPVVDRAALNMGTAFLASPLFKWAAGMGVKARPATAPAPAAAKGANTGLATPRREIVGAAVPRHTITGSTGALSAAEAARLAAR